MKPAAENMKFFLQKKEFQKPKIQLISNVTALPVEKDGDIRDLLFKQIFSQVRWRESVEYMIKNVERSYEHVFDILKKIDEHSLSLGHSINIKLVKKFLKDE